MNAGRDRTEIQNIIGIFVNTLALRSYPKKEKIFQDYLQEVNKICLSVFDNQHYPFEELIDILNVSRDMSRNPVFDTVFILQNFEVFNSSFGDLTIERIKRKVISSKYDIEVVVFERDNKLLFNITYNTTLFTSGTIQTLVLHLEHLLKSIISSPGKKIKELSLISNNEKKKLLDEFNDTNRAYSKEDTIISLFEKQAEQTPHNTAIICGNEKMTYSILNKKANAIANIIQNKVPGDNPHYIGLLFQSSFEMIISILGILKTGCAYIPLSVDSPAERNNFILADSNVSLLLVQENIYKSEYISQLNYNRENIVSIGEDIPENDLILFKNKQITSEHIINVIYTSGTTGNPKGVKVKHKGIVNYIQWRINNYNFKPDDVTLQVLSYVWDAYGTNLYSSILSGGSLVIMPEEQKFNIEYIVGSIKQNSVTNFCMTPTFYELVVNKINTGEEFKTLRFVTLGGEAANKNLLKQSKAKLPNVTIHNEYGPTETSIGNTHLKDINPDRPQIIGKPISNNQTFILNETKDLVPVCIPGELYISGEGISKGYLNNEQLTLEKFVDNPFIRGSKMYKTGDSARWLPDGNIEYLGRIDSQVKINGIRVELGEIEHCLTSSPLINESVVLIKKDSLDKYLVAFYTSEQEVNVDELRDFLSLKLPSYMIPQVFIKIDKIPIASSGKADRKKLASLELTINTERKYIKPRNETEKGLVDIFKAFFNNDQIGINDNFFELGGDSIKAITLVSRINSKLQINLSISNIIENPLISQLAKHIQNSAKESFKPIKPARQAEYYPVSSKQRRLFALQELNKSATTYNMPSFYVIKGNVDISRLMGAFQQLVNRHETLRTYFEVRGEELVQKISPGIEFKPIVKSVTEAELLEKKERFRRPFDLQKAPLLRVEIYNTAGKHYLFIDMHHIISDGVSIRIFFDELKALYQNKTLPALEIQYKDYAVWEHMYLKDDMLERQRQYWLNQFKDEIPVLEFPTDYSRPATQGNEADVETLKLSASDTAALRAIARQQNITLYTLLLSIYKVLLAKYTGQDDIVVGTVNAGRDRMDVQKIIGMFVNTLALRSFPLGKKSFYEFLNEVNETCISAFDNQHFPFEKLIDELNVTRDISRNPLFDTLFVLQNFEKLNLIAGELSIERMKRGILSSKFDIEVVVYEKNNELLFNFIYAKALFVNRTMQQLAIRFKQLIHNIILNPGALIKDLQIIGDTEKKLVVDSFNNTNADYPRDETVCSLFEKQAKKTPGNTAVIVNDKAMSYRELDLLSNKVANFIHQKYSVKSGDKVGILLQREEMLIPSILGILKAGGAYIPIDPNFPGNRISMILEDSKINLLISRTPFLSAEIKENNVSIIDLNECQEEINAFESKKLNTRIYPGSLIYVIYTSGTTGKPKGVMIEHRSVVNRLVWMQEKYPISENDVLMQKTNVTFDVSVWELFWWMFAGASVTLLKPGGEKDPDEIIKAVEKHNVTTIHFVPSLLGVFLNTLTEEKFKYLISLNYVFSSGEALTANHVKMFNKTLKQNSNTRLINLYGPTEATVDVSYFECNNNDSCIPIGKPINNTRFYILNKHNQLCPPGIAGELCIAGIQLARGYLGNEKLTNEKFIKITGIPEERIYRTGDLARWLPDGNVEYIGRIDNQVKINGNRIELGDIEHHLSSHPFIKECIVIIKTVNNENYLVAYYTSDNKISSNELRDYLKSALPQYMIPHLFLRIDEIPLSSNGKADRKKLAGLAINTQNEKKYEKPGNHTENILVSIFSKFFNNNQIGISDDFFEIGGDSIKAIALVARINKKLKTNLSISSIIENPTIKILAKEIEKNNRSVPESYLYKKKTFFTVYNNINIYNILYSPQKEDAKTGIIICPPIAQEHIVAAFTLSHLADKIAGYGFPVLSFDFAGNGNSQGNIADFTINEWIDNISNARAKLKSLFDLEKIIVIGLRFGATLSMLESAKNNTDDSLILWEPVLNGGNYFSELQRNHKRWLNGSYAVQKQKYKKGVELQGFYFPDKLSEEIKNTDISKCCFNKDLNIRILANDNQFQNHFLDKFEFSQSTNRDFWNKQTKERVKRLIPEKEFEVILQWISNF